MIDENDRRLLKLYSGCALTTLGSVHLSFLIAERAIEEGIKGCFVECGVYCGTQCAAMAHAAMKHKEFRKVHLLDSFCGIPQAGPEDSEQPGIGSVPLGTGTGELVSTGVSSCSVEGVKGLMFEWAIDEEMLEYHEGWFQTTVPFFRPGPIAVLRLDGDLYESTKICLEYLYPWLETGGYLIIDDYSLRGCRTATDEYFKALKRDPQFVDPDVGYGIVWHRNPSRLIRKKP